MHFTDRELIEAFEDEMAAVRGDVPFDLPPLKRPATYGVFPWWPEPGTAWIHEDDVGLANQWIPSDRIFKREDLPDGWARLSYGPQSIRIRPTMWLEVPTDGYEIGDPVEVNSNGGRESPLVAKIGQIRWDARKRQVLYQLEQKGTRLPKKYLANQFRIVKPIGGELSLRQQRLLERSFLR